MINEVNAVVFRQNLGDMLNQVQYRHDSILIKKDGKPVAAFVDAQLFDRIRRLKKRSAPPYRVGWVEQRETHQSN